MVDRGLATWDGEQLKMHADDPRFASIPRKPMQRATLTVEPIRVELEDGLRIDGGPMQTFLTYPQKDQTTMKRAA